MNVGGILDPDGRPMVVIDAAVAAWLVAPVREVVRQHARRDGVPVPARVAAALREMESAARSLAIEVRSLEPGWNLPEQAPVRLEPAPDPDERMMPSMDIDTAARVIGRSPSFVRRLRREGRLIGHKVGAGWRIFEWSVAAYLFDRDRKEQPS